MDGEQKKKGKGPPPPEGQGQMIRDVIVWVLLLTSFLVIGQMFFKGPEKNEPLKYYPEFYQLVVSGQVATCEIVRDAQGAQYVRGKLIATDGKMKPFRVDVQMTEELPKFLEAHKVEFKYTMESSYIWQVVGYVLPFVLIMGLFYFFFVRQMKIAGRGALSFGKSRARLLTRDRNKVTFKDVAGVDEAKDELQEIIEFLRDPKRYQKLGGRIPKGVMLVGAPGTGKTLLAKAIAGEADVPFFSISGSDFVEMFVGVGASRVRDMFEQGRKNAPCIIFIDEIDAVGRSRFSGIGGGHDEREQTLNALLVEMDGFDTQEGVIIIAATNRPDVLDTALLRPGRFDRQVVVDLPDLDGRKAILMIHSARVKLAANADLRRVARGTPGFSGADLANLINEAALLGARRGAEAIENRDLEEARDKVRWGRERRSRHMDDKEKGLTAHHEAGHAIVLTVVEGAEPLHKVTIIPRGAALGSTMQLPEKDRYTQNRTGLISIITGLMGGRAAEEICFGDITTGAQSDIKQATHIARMMVCEWGMSPELGPQSLAESEDLLFMGREVARSHTLSEETARRIDGEVQRILTESHARAVAILSERRALLEQVAALLIERETLDGQDVRDLVAHGRILSEAERGPTGDEPGVTVAPTPAAEGPAGHADGNPMAVS